jgi:hypothetical protein
VFGLGDEVAGAAARGVRETGEEAAGRATQQVAETAETRLGREAAEETGGRAAAQPADELGEGALKAADDPKVPTIKDEAARATELLRALAEARGIEAFHDAIDSPIPVLMFSLGLLKRRYRWIETFTATPIGIGVYRIELVASPGIAVGTYSVDMRRAKDTLIHINETYGHLVRADTRLVRRFRRITRLAATDPAESARLAAALEQELAQRTEREIRDVIASETRRGTTGGGPAADPRGVPLEEGPSALSETTRHRAGVRDLDADAARAQLRENLPARPSAVPGEWQAHHIVPYELRDHPLVYEMRTRFGFDINGRGNGIWLPTSEAVPAGQGLTVHLGSHRQYTSAVENRLDQLYRSYRTGAVPESHILREFEDVIGEFENLLRTSAFGRPLPGGGRVAR